MKGYSWLRKLVVGIVITVVIVIAAVITFSSPVAKYLLEKYDMEILGRQVTVDHAYVNPFTGYICLKNLVISEARKDTVFLSVKEVRADFEMFKMLRKTYEISEITLDRPWGIIVQDQKKKELNFDDLIERFRSKPDTSRQEPSRGPEAPREPTHVNILRIRIINGEFHYRERVIPINYFIKDVNIASPGKRWDNDTLVSDFSFTSGEGKATGRFAINTGNSDYKIETDIRNFSLEIIRQYLWELINYGLFTARLDAKANVSGNFNDPDSVNVVGQIAINDFHLSKAKNEDYASFKKLQLIIRQLNPDGHKYLFDSITIDKPFFKYEQFDSLDNIQAMFGKRGSNISDVTRQPGRFNLVIEIARYIKTLSREFFASDYRINALAINQGSFEYDDYSLSERFSLSSHAVKFRADSIHKENKRVHAMLRSRILHHGTLGLDLSINPVDSNYFDLKFHIQRVPVSAFNPYLISKTSFPLDRGTLEVNGLWNVRDGFIHGNNHIVVLNPRVSDRLRNKDTRWIPMPLIMSVVRERGNVIDYEVPVTGNLKNPKFHLQNVIAHLVENILVKPPTIPYGIKVKNLENQIEESLTLRLAMRQVALEPAQKKFVTRIADFLKHNPQASIVVSPKQFETKEKEHILYFETKKKYFLRTHGKSAREFSKDDSIAVEAMSIKALRHELVRDMRKATRDTTMFTIIDRCRHYLKGDGLVNRKFNHLVKARETEFYSYFKNNGTASRVTMSKSENEIPYGGFSFFKIAYKGQLPKPLLKAHREMMDLNQQAPRKKYFAHKVDRRFVLTK